MPNVWREQAEVSTMLRIELAEVLSNHSGFLGRVYITVSC